MTTWHSLAPETWIGREDRRWKPGRTCFFITKTLGISWGVLLQIDESRISKHEGDARQNWILYLENRLVYTNHYVKLPQSVVPCEYKFEPCPHCCRPCKQAIHWMNIMKKSLKSSQLASCFSAFPPGPSRPPNSRGSRSKSTKVKAETLATVSMIPGRKGIQTSFTSEEWCNEWCVTKYGKQHNKPW